MPLQIDEFSKYKSIYPTEWGIETFCQTYYFFNDNPVDCFRSYLRFLSITQSDTTIFSNLDILTGDNKSKTRQAHSSFALFETRGCRAYRLFQNFKIDCTNFAKQMGWDIKDIELDPLNFRVKPVKNHLKRSFEDENTNNDIDLTHAKKRLKVDIHA